MPNIIGMEVRPRRIIVTRNDGSIVRINTTDIQERYDQATGGRANKRTNVMNWFRNRIRSRVPELSGCLIDFDFDDLDVGERRCRCTRLRFEDDIGA